MSVTISGSNSEILNAVRANASHDYQARIPVATDATISKTMNELQRYTPMWNEFVHTLLNTVGLRFFNENHYENRLKPLKNGSMPFGGMVEEFSTDLIKGEDYNSLDTNVFAPAKPDIKVNWHRINSRRRYKLSVNEDLLTEACFSEGGLAQFVQMVMAAPQESAEWDEYLLMLQLLSKYQAADGFANINVPDILTSADPEADGKKLVEKVATWYEKSRFFRTDTNAEGINAVSRNMILLTTPEIAASQNVNVLAAAFNIDRAKFVSDQTIVVDQWPEGLEGTQAMLLDKDFYKVFDTKNTMRSIQNPATLDMVYYLHRWGIFSASRMRPAIRFSTDEETIAIPTTKSVSSVGLTAYVDGTTDKTEVLHNGATYNLVGENFYSDATTDNHVYIEISAASSTAPGTDAKTLAIVKPDTGTYIGDGFEVSENKGIGTHYFVLRTNEAFTYDSITITAISIPDGSKNASITLTKEQS